MSTRLTEEQKQQVRFWFNIIGCELVACHTRTKAIKEYWSNNLNGNIDYDARLEQGLYDDGVAIICGRIRRKEYAGRYIGCLDFDTLEAFERFSAGIFDLNKLGSTTRVEWHVDDPSRIKVFFMSSRSFRNDRGGGLEVKGNKLLAFVSPSIHKDGKPYTAFGTEEIAHLDNVGQMRIENCIAAVIPNYQSEDQTNEYIRYLELDTTILHEGERHNGILAIANSYFFRYKGEWKDLTDGQRFDKLIEYDKKHCRPSLYETSETEFKQIWRDIERKYTEERDEREFAREKSREQGQGRYAEYGPDVSAELEGNVFYKINEKPPRFIIAYNQTKKLIEARLKEGESEQLVNGQTQTIEFKYLIHNKTYLTCIPIKIIRHKNPLAFLDIAAKYSMSFIDAAGEHVTFRHKTLSEILGGLRDLGYILQNDGAEGALGAMVQAYKETKIIEDNTDIEFTGFFLQNNNNDGKVIIASNIEIKQKDNLSADNLADGLKCINELAKYYEGRVDLLATSIIWGMAAPLSFILKETGSFLKWLHYWGFPNSSKSSTGKIILAIDRHHNDSKYVLNISNIDSVPRLGDAMRKTTFPKLVDEVVFSETLRFMINQLKSAIESRILRSKFMNSNSGSVTDIPALCPFIMTSNPPPPFHDSAYMRRIIERSFSQSETHKENEPMAIEFKEFLRINLDRLGYLGDFRNHFIIQNQTVVLDKKLTPIGLGKKILIAAYEYANMLIPEWFDDDKLLPETQLEDSLVNNQVIVKRAFEAYINDEFNHAISYFRVQDKEIKLPEKISNRLARLIDEHLLPDIKRDKSYNIIIYVGILENLYKRGVTGDQLPNLKALADYMGANYVRVRPGNRVVRVTGGQLGDYFDAIIDDPE